jgi:O-antigen/teichoic acid export membrane protein
MYSWASIFNALLSFGMETTFFRYLIKYEDRKDRVYNNTFWAIIALSAIFLSFSILFIDDISAWMQKDSLTPVADYAIYVKYFIYILVVDALCVIPFSKIRAEGRPIRYGLIKMINILCFIALNIIFILVIPALIENGGETAAFLSSWYRQGWIGYIFISNLSASILTLIILLPEISQLRLNLDFSMFKDMLFYSFPILIANISFIINENIDKIFLDKLLPASISDAQVGIYGACCKLAIFLNLFIQAFRLGAEPFFFNYSKNKNSGEIYARIMSYFVIAMTLIFVGLVANIEILKYFIRGKDYQEYWSGLKVVPVLLFGYMALGIYMNLSVWYKLSDQTRYGLYISGIGALLTIVLNFIFIPKYSFMASAWVSLTAYSTMMILSYILGQKKYPIPYNLLKILGYLSVSAILVYLSFYVFHRDLLIGNCIFLAFIIMSVYIERKELKLIFLKK